MFVLRLPPRAWLVLAFALAFSAIGLRRASSQANEFNTLSPQESRPGQVFTVTNTNDSGPGSLRQALTDANVVPGTDIHTNSVEGYFSRIRRSIHGVYHSVSRAHLHRYLAEWDFEQTTRRLTDGAPTST